MLSQELQKRLDEGELLFCPECDLFGLETEECEIVCCNNPFTGPYEGEVQDHYKLITQNFEKFYNKEV